MLRTPLLSLAACLALALPCRAADLPEINLWTEGHPEPRVPAEPAELVEKASDGSGRRTNISQPRLVVYAPKADVKKTGTGIIVIPGGGFGRLADTHEGSDACAWLADQGVVAFLLLHRTPTNKHTAPHAGPVQDAQRAVSIVRRRAAEFGVDPQRLGVLGFSAGGQVAIIAATNDLKYPVPAGAETVSHKPDFLLLLYPWQIYNAETKSLRSEIRLDHGLPPTFIAQMGDDRGSLPQGSTLLYLELINRQVPAEIHIYEKGGHGFGMQTRPNATGPGDWPARASDWLRLRGLLK